MSATRKMYSLTIRIKKNDELNGKRLQKALLEFMTNAGVAGATVWVGVDGFGKRGASTFQKEGLTYDAPMLIEVIEEKEKLDSVIPEIKKMIGGNGLLTMHAVEIV